MGRRASLESSVLRLEQRHGRVDARAPLERGSLAHVVVVVVFGILVFDGGQGADLERFGVVLVGVLGARLNVVQRFDLAADGERLLLTDRRSTGLAEVGDGQRIGSLLRLASAKDHRNVRPVSPELPDPLVLDVVERDGVRNLVAEEEDVGLLVRQRTHGVVRG